MIARKDANAFTETNDKVKVTVFETEEAKEEENALVRELRKIGALCGFVDAERGSLWLRLMRVSDISSVRFQRNSLNMDDDVDHEEQLRTIRADVVRCCHEYERDEEKQGRERQMLEKVLKGVFGGCGGRRVRYYQGFHCVARVVLSTYEREFDEIERFKKSCAVLDRLVFFSMRDYARETMYPVILNIKIIFTRLIEKACDRELVAAIRFAGHDCQWALQKILCWHSMSADARNLDEVEEGEEKCRLACVRRLFDLFLFNHPLMPLYVVVAILLRDRNKIVRARDEDDDPDTLYSFLSRLETIPKLKHYKRKEDDNNKAMRKQRQREAVDELVLRALKLFSECPLTEIVRKRELETIFVGSSFHSSHYPPPYFLPTTKKNFLPSPLDIEHTIDIVHAGERLEIRKASRSRTLSQYSRKLKQYDRSRTISLLKFIIFYRIYFEFLLMMNFHRLAYGPTVVNVLPSKTSVFAFYWRLVVKWMFQ